MTAQPDVFDIPDEWLQAAFDAIGRTNGADGDDQVRAILAAVLPLHAQRVRAGIVTELKAHANDCEVRANDRDAVPDVQERMYLHEEAEYMAAAARYIAIDPEAPEQDDAEAAHPAKTTQQLARRYGSAADAQDTNTEK